MSKSVSPQTPSPLGNAYKFLSHLADSLGLQRYAGHATFMVVLAGMIWFGRANLLGSVPTSMNVEAFAQIGEAPATPTPVVNPEAVWAAPLAAESDSGDLTRETTLHTNIPTRPRTEIASYTVQSGDTLFGIAEKFGLQPETIVWGNPILKDDPHLLRPGQTLRIPPIDGVLHDVHETNTLEGLAAAFNVTVDDIVNWPGNELDIENPQLTPGQLLMAPGGRREFVQFVIPQIVRTRRNALPADAGPGACPGGYTGGNIGTGFFVWPANAHYLSGNNYWAGHLGIDIAAGFGDPIYASDSGVTVFAGWSNWGYGNMVVIDHGNGWQTLYAHLRDTGVLSRCGESVVQGQIIGWAGSTGNSSGPHLHFEMNYNGSRPNPWNYLPPP